MMDEPGLLPMLTIVSGSMRGTSFRLSPGSRVIGRVESADIVIDDLQVSRRHAAVRLAGGQVSLADMGSTNGTWLNDQRLNGVERLTDGDRIRVGGVELRFFDPSSAVTVPVNGFRVPPVAPAPPRPPSAALVGPTDAIVTDSAGRPHRVLLALGAGIAAAGGITGAYLMFQ
ncbi:FHA domain-containing protein [Micromonospora echinofusca]|uniref:FHA domain-containing protein n=1 Tax=Micromonospora echinofusca TaxID=47858 RepID=A0ABS3VLB3_MICEH|nr:FHA domain-containing protein [Micromonospora echinofusca]MBO4205233.1 FHA domain-containing protein [Micromonospora echinofusca]